MLARPIAAPLPLPPFTNSAVDGYAVASRDLPQGEARAFAVTGRIAAGASAIPAIQPGQAMRIFTGAPMPEGADTVFMQEDVQIADDGKVVLPAGLRPGANVRPAGEDIAAGHAALAAGLRLRPQDVALAAAFGLTHLDVVRRIRVAVFSTGDELVSPGGKPCARAIVRFQPLHADGDAEAARLRGLAISAFSATIAPRWRTRCKRRPAITI